MRHKQTPQTDCCIGSPDGRPGRFPACISATRFHAAADERIRRNPACFAAVPQPQNSQSLSSIHVPDFEPMKQNRFIAVERPSRRSWLALAAVEHGAAAFDAYSTRDAISHGAVEDDPLMRPFANSPAIYAASQVGPLVLDYVARRMQRSNNSFARRMWWLPQSAATAEFIFCGVHNLHVANQP